MRNNRDRNGRPHFFGELLPLAGAITHLQPASLPPSKPASKLGAAQRKRERKAAKRLAELGKGRDA